MKNEKRIYSSHHTSEQDSKLLNKALEKSIANEEFITSSVNLLKDLKFPTYKHRIIEHVKKMTNDKIITSLFYTLSDSLEIKNISHIENILKANIPKKNSLYNTKNPDELNVNPLSDDTHEKLSQTEDKNLPPRAAMHEYTCARCGKSFLTRENLETHQEFEG